MSKPYIHALSSAKNFGGIPEDYMDIHNLLDSSKAVCPDNRHRALTHNSWFIGHIIPLIFGETFARKSDGVIVSSRDIAEQHVLEDYRNKFIPTPQDFLEEMTFKPWMQNALGGEPSSNKKIKEFIKSTEVIPSFPKSNFRPKPIHRSNVVLDGNQHRHLPFTKSIETEPKIETEETNNDSSVEINKSPYPEGYDYLGLGEGNITLD